MIEKTAIEVLGIQASRPMDLCIDSRDLSTPEDGFRNGQAMIQRVTQTSPRFYIAS